MTTKTVEPHLSHSHQKNTAFHSRNQLATALATTNSEQFLLATRA